MEEYRIIYMDMPYTVKGLTVKDENGFYNIYIKFDMRNQQLETRYFEILVFIKVHKFQNTRRQHPNRPRQISDKNLICAASNRILGFLKFSVHRST